jgi:hypothetical protein
MPTPIFEIMYADQQKKEFPNATAVRKFLDIEQEIWQPFLDEVLKEGSLIQRHHQEFTFRYQSVNFVLLSEPFKRMRDDLLKSSEAGRSWQTNTMGPPPSDSLIGRLIIGLFSSGYTSQSVDVYAYYLSLPGRGNNLRNLSAYIDRGRRYFEATYAVEAMPFGKVSGAKVGAAKRALDVQLAAVKEEVEKLQNLRDQLAEEFEQTKAEKSKSFSDEISARNNEAQEMRDVEHELFSELQEKIEEVYERLSADMRQTTMTGKVQNERNQKEYERVKKLFFEDMKFQAPVRLWSLRERQHKEAAKRSFWLFMGLAIIAVSVAVVVPVYFGDQIAESFFVSTDKFSAKGPLLVGGLLTTMSVLLWIVRLQYKVFLSERHLMLDAAEKRLSLSHTGLCVVIKRLARIVRRSCSPLCSGQLRMELSKTMKVA